MVKPASFFNAEAGSFGGELILRWGLPEDYSEDSKIIIFKRSKEEPTEAEIDKYFQCIDDLSNFNYNKLFVFDSEDKFAYDTLSDLSVLNGTDYHYKIVIYNTKTKERSSSVAVVGKPKPRIRVNVLDGKEVVEKSLTKLFDNIYTDNHRKVSIGRDIRITKAFGVGEVSGNLIMLERVNSADYQRYWGNKYASSAVGSIEGKITSDIIRATFLTNSLDRRESFANIIRAYSIVLEKFCNLYGETRGTEVIIEGDYYNPSIHGVDAVGFAIVFNIKMETKMLIPKKDLEVIIEDIRLEHSKGKNL